MGAKCPHCPAEYSTEQELHVHRSNVGDHLVERLRRVQTAAQAVSDAFSPKEPLVLSETGVEFGRRLDKLRDELRWVDVVDE